MFPGMTANSGSLRVCSSLHFLDCPTTRLRMLNWWNRKAMPQDLSVSDRPISEILRADKYPTMHLLWQKCAHAHMCAFLLQNGELSICDWCMMGFVRLLLSHAMDVCATQQMQHMTWNKFCWFHHTKPSNYSNWNTALCWSSMFKWDRNIKKSQLIIVTVTGLSVDLFLISRRLRMEVDSRTPRTWKQIYRQFSYCD